MNEATKKPGTLYVVATPIGNRDDLAPRARQVLDAVDVIAAEDTRHTGRLLSHFGIDTPQIALHDHNENQQADAIIARLVSGADVALVSDAGTPLVSDPGYRLVAEARAAGLAVSPLPGASAVTAALSVSGLPTDRFAFEGFLPPRGEARRRRLRQLVSEPRTLVFLESVHKIDACVADLVAEFGADRLAFVGRELTKLHEQCVRATLGDIADGLARGRIVKKGEFVLITAGAPSPSSDEDDTQRYSVDALLQELLAEMSTAKAVRIAVRLTGQKRNRLYERALELQSRQRD